MSVEEFSSWVGIDRERIKAFDEGRDVPTIEEIKIITNKIYAHYKSKDESETSFEDALQNSLKEIESVLRKVPDLLRRRPFPQFDGWITQLYNEAKNCIVASSHTSAIAALVILIEYALKDLICEKKNKIHNGKLPPKEEEQIWTYNLERAIKVASKFNIIDKKEKKFLEWIREWVRNTTFHSNLVKETQHDIVGEVIGIFLETGTSEKRAYVGKKPLAIRKINKIERDRDFAYPFFRWVETFICKKYAPLIKKIQNGEIRPGAFFRENLHQD